MVDKVATLTSLEDARTGKAAGDPNLFDLAIGETITYEITAALPEGEIRGFNIRDKLPQTLQILNYLPGTAVVGSIGDNLFTNASWTTKLTNSGISESPTGTINFGFNTTVFNRPDGVADNKDVVKVKLTAFVPNVPGNIAGQKVINTGIVDYGEYKPSDLNSFDPKEVKKEVAAEIVEPIFDLTKNTITESVERGDQVIYTVTLKNAAVASAAPGSSNPQGVFSAPAFDVTIDDGLLPGKLTLVPHSAKIITAGTTASASVSEVDVGGNMVVRITSAEIGTGKQIQFEYTAVVSASVEAGTNLVNKVTLKGDSHPITPTPPPDQRNYELYATETVTVKSPTLSKTVAATSIDETGSSFHDASLVDLAIGEIVTYRITVTAPEAVTTNFKVIDTLPFALQGGFKTIDAKVDVNGIGSNLSIGSGKPVISWNDTTATFDFGTVTANAADRPASENQIRLLVKARVEDVAGVIKDGVQATNEAKLTFGSIGQQATANVTVDIVEPKLKITKAITNPSGFVKPGETVDYTVTVSHLGTSTAPAFDLKVKDLISDPYLALVAGSISSNRTINITSAEKGFEVTTNKLLRNEPLAAGDVWTISFKAIVLPTTPGGVTIDNIATSSFDSAPGPSGRPDGGSASASIPGSPSFEKSIISTSNPDTGSSMFDPTLPDLTIGEKLTYKMVLTLPQGTTQNVSITDLLPAGLVPLEARVVSLGSLTAAP
ncbi:MAG: isopeptide-forming domain-containing fimbrial protein, partial [Pseudomonadota bacterium]